MKKRLAFALSALMIFSLCGCGGVYVPPQGGGTQGNPTDPPVPAEGVLFSVQLVNDGIPFSPQQPMSAVWTGTDGIHAADFNAAGRAEITGLDGDYQVTLTNVPEGMAYDTNSYSANNDHPEISVELVKIKGSFTGKESSASSKPELNPEIISEEGTYRVVLPSKESKAFCAFLPQTAGLYSIASWVDITANEINPKVDLYNGQIHIIEYFYLTQDDGGLSSTYTKNFRFEMELNEERIGNGWVFSVYADCRSGNYPVHVDFTLKYEGEDRIEDTVYETATAEGPFMREAESGTFRFIWEDSGRILDASLVKYNPEDGFYHLYSEDTGYGKILHVMLGNDFDPIYQTDSGHGMLDDLAQAILKCEGVDYTEMIRTYNSRGANGAHPVNLQLKEFLQTLAGAQNYFCDGDGWAEMGGLQSTEENMWLFACGYYT